MVDTIFEPAFKREAAGLTRKLALGGGYLLRHGDTGPWSLWSRKNGLAKPIGHVPHSLVSEMQRRSLLKPRPGGGLVPAQQVRRPTIPVTIAGPDALIVAIERSEVESALDWLKGRKDQNGRALLGEEQFAAAERLRSDYTQAQLEGRLTANWDNPIESGSRGRSAHGHAPLSERALAAKDRLFAALHHVGPELSGILLETCCMASGLEHAERLLGLPRRSGKAILEIALTRLARHYGLLPDEKPRLSDKSRTRRWATADYRPRIG
jgi:Domain of unknown function (DUF6456)